MQSVRPTRPLTCLLACCNYIDSTDYELDEKAGPVDGKQADSEALTASTGSCGDTVGLCARDPHRILCHRSRPYAVVCSSSADRRVKSEERTRGVSQGGSRAGGGTAGRSGAPRSPLATAGRSPTAGYFLPSSMFVFSGSVEIPATPIPPQAARAGRYRRLLS